MGEMGGTSAHPTHLDGVGSLGSRRMGCDMVQKKEYESNPPSQQLVRVAADQCFNCPPLQRLPASCRPQRQLEDRTIRNTSKSAQPEI